MKVKYLQAVGTSAIGAIAEVPDAQANGLIAAGIAQAVPAETERAADATLDTLRSEMTTLVASAITQATRGTAQGRPLNLHPGSPGDDGAAEDGMHERWLERRAALATRGNWAEYQGTTLESVREEHSLGDFFQCLAYCASPSHPRYQGANNRLHNKYRSRFNPDFGQDWARGSRSMPDNPNAQRRNAGGDDQWSRASNMIETTGSLGGFTVPLQFYPELIRLAQQMAVLFPKVRKYPMAGLQMQVPALDYTTASTGKSPYLAGMAAGWTAEGQTFAQTNANFRQITLKANILSGYTVASRTLLADSAVGLEAVLMELISETIGYYVDYAILLGTGVDQPLGIKTAGCTLAQSRTSVANGSFLADLGSMYGKMLPEAEGRAFWLLPPSAKTAFVSMTGPNGAVVWIPNIVADGGGGATRPLPIQTFGHQMFVSQLPASSLTSGDIYFIDPMNYAFGLRQDIEIGVSEHVNFLSNLLTWRFLMRGDGQPRINTFLTLANGDTVSPFVYFESIPANERLKSLHRSTFTGILSS